MSIEHILKFESERSTKDIMNLLVSNISEFQPTDHEELKTEGYLLNVYENSKISRQHFHEEYGFAPKLRVTFYQNTDENFEKGDLAVGKAIALILKREGNAVFFYVIDTPILKRIDDKIWVAEEKWYEWLRNALDEADLSYELKPEEAFLEELIS